MAQFIQLHMLTSYPPSNLNRDDLGRPKTAIMGGSQRLRVSSQSLKRAWRTSSHFKETLKGQIGVRTRQLGCDLFTRLKQAGVNEKIAGDFAQKITKQLGPVNSKKVEGYLLNNSQLVHLSPEELQAVDTLVDEFIKTQEQPSDKNLQLLLKPKTATDIALFGRMLSQEPQFSMEASTQVAHALTVHEVAVEDDFFTAVDDLNTGGDDRGSGHMGEIEFGAGLFYLYICIDRDQLLSNLGENVSLASKCVQALVQVAATVAPTGKQNSFASRAYASYIMAEKGQQQPRSLSVAFLTALRPRKNEDLLQSAAARLHEEMSSMDKAYGACAEGRYIVDTRQGTGTLHDLLRFVGE